MAQGRNVEVTAGASPTRSIAELRSAVAQTRAQIDATVNAIEVRVSTAVEAFLPDGHTATNGANARSVAGILAGLSAIRMLARRVSKRTSPGSRIATLAILGVGVGLWMWLRPTRRPEVLSQHARDDM